MGHTSHEFDFTQEERQLDVTRYLYKDFFIETPIGDATFEAADEDSNMIEVTIQLVDPAGQPMVGPFQAGLFLCDDEDGLNAAAAPGGVVVTTGTEVQEIVAAQHIQCLTDATGKLVVEITDAVGAATYYLGVFLPNGRYTVSDAIVFAA
jgi:hypothetical protein